MNDLLRHSTAASRFSIASRNMVVPGVRHYPCATTVIEKYKNNQMTVVLFDGQHQYLRFPVQIYSFPVPHVELSSFQSYHVAKLRSKQGNVTDSWSATSDESISCFTSASLTFAQTQVEFCTVWTWGHQQQRRVQQRRVLASSQTNYATLHQLACTVALRYAIYALWFNGN